MATSTPDKTFPPPLAALEEGAAGRGDLMTMSAAAAIVSPTGNSPAAAVNRSSSVGGGLDAIVDLLGVPSELLAPADLSKRLVLLDEREEDEEEDDHKEQPAGRPRLEKSKSCDGVKRRRRRRRNKGGSLSIP